MWVADYVLGSYGSGAIMAVPAHDSRDHEFAVTFGLAVRAVVAPAAGGEEASTSTSGGGEGLFTGAGVAVNSASEAAGLDLDGLPTAAAKARVIEWLAAGGLGRQQVNFKLRDWLFARQRYWGEPFPVVYADGSPVRHAGGLAGWGGVLPGGRPGVLPGAGGGPRGGQQQRWPGRRQQAQRRRRSFSSDLGAEGP